MFIVHCTITIMEAISILSTIPLLSNHDEPGTALESQIDLFSAAANPSTAARLCGAILGRYSPERLTSSKNKSISIQAAWRLYNRPERSEKPRFGSTVPVRSTVPLQRFIGFVEGKLDTNVPLWWEKMIESPNLLHPSRTKLIKMDWLAPPELPANIGEGFTDVICKGRKIPVPNPTLAWLCDGQSIQFSLLIDGPLRLIVSEAVPGKYSRMACCDSITNLEIWRVELWGAGNSVQMSTGPLQQRIDFMNVVVGDDRVSVFSARSMGVESETDGYTCIAANFSIEQFERIDGACVARFSSDEWSTEIEN